MAAISVVEKSGLQETIDGAFVRSASAHRSIIGADPAFPPESGRYLLVVSHACPWAHRCVIVRALLGLENAVPLCVVHPTWAATKPDVDGHRGWVFVDPKSDPITHPSGVNTVSNQGCVLPPPEFAKEWTSVRSIYDASGDGDAKKFTVPILFDMQNKTIVNNESSEILRMLYNPKSIGQFASKNESLDLRPASLAQHIDETNAWVYDQINDGVYKAGLAHSQSEYEKAATALKAGLQRVESILQNSKYLCSMEMITEADVRLFVTLIRHDEVYVTYFKCNHCPILFGDEFPNIVQYMRMLYAIPEVRGTINMGHIKNHYYTSHPSLNPYGVVPLGRGALERLEGIALRVDDFE